MPGRRSSRGPAEEQPAYLARDAGLIVGEKRGGWVRRRVVLDRLAQLRTALG